MKKIFNSIGVVFVCFVATGFYFYLLGTNAALEVRTVAKVIPIWSMLVMARALGSNSPATTPTSYAKRICVGLLLCSFGDVFLELEKIPGNESFFILGLASFLVGHIMYILAFGRNSVTLSMRTVVPLLAYAMAMFAILFPHLEPELVAPVFIYANAIGCMAIFSVCRDPGTGTTGDENAAGFSWTAGVVGAFVFVISDTVLAVDKFVAPFENAKIVVMVTYYIGQFGIALSALGGESPGDRKIK